MVRDDGSLDVERMKDGTRAQLRDVFTNPRTVREFGAATVPGAAAPAFPPAVSQAIVNLLSGVEMLAISKITKAPADIIKRVVPYDENEVKMLTPPIDALLTKYGGTAFAKYGDEVALVLILSTLFTAKLAAVRQLMANQGATTTDQGQQSQDGGAAFVPA